ncbi:MAG: hypothetical protein OEM02_14575 [Desulfobulbaceae bacterium]|nr:hypothetical protein [Desulfobulbaceae bacterium]
MQLELRYRASFNESIESRHEGLMRLFCKIPGCWGLKGTVLPTVPDIGGELMVQCDLKDFLGAGVSGRLVYVFRDRNYLKDSSQYDDCMFIELNPELIPYKELVNRMFIDYVRLFEPYRATIILDEELALDDWDIISEMREDAKIDVDGRDTIYRLNSVNYFDELLCRRSFGLTLKEIITRLEGNVETISLEGNGVLIIYSTQILKRSEIENINEKLLPLLYRKNALH